MRCPLILVAPGLGPGVDRSIAQQIDILPTVLSILGVAPPEGLPGRDLLVAGAPERPVFMERDRPPPFRQRAVMQGNHKLVAIEEFAPESLPHKSRLTYTPVTNVAAGLYLYHLAKDPGETSNVYREGDPRSEELLALLDEHFSVAPRRSGEIDVGEELRDRLRDLGYGR